MTTPSIALQLYSIRHELDRDLRGTLQAVAEMGYAGVEPAGLHGMDPKEVRKVLADLQLVCCSTHGPMPTRDTVNQRVDEAGGPVQAMAEFHKNMVGARPYFEISILTCDIIHVVDCLRFLLGDATEVHSDVQQADVLPGLVPGGHRLRGLSERRAGLSPVRTEQPARSPTGQD